jgi:hypothetical protein
MENRIMEIVVQARDITLSEELHRHVARSLERALARHRLWVRRIEVLLTAGSCVVRVRLQRLIAIAVRQPGSDLYMAVARAAEAAGSAVARRMARRIRVKRLFGLQGAAA